MTLATGSPYSGPLLDGSWTVSQAFGCTDVTFEWRNCQGCAFFHAGIDLSGGGIIGTAVHALGHGVVTRVGFNVGSCCLSPDGTCGGGPFAVVVWSGDKDFWFFHLRDNVVNVGDLVFEGDVLGHVGTEGCSTGGHLHYQVQPHGIEANCADAIDPTPYLGAHSWPDQTARFTPPPPPAPPGPELPPVLGCPPGFVGDPSGCIPLVAPPVTPLPSNPLLDFLLIAGGAALTVHALRRGVVRDDVANLARRLEGGIGLHRVQRNERRAAFTR